jgi:hypothetical protein
MERRGLLPEQFFKYVTAPVNQDDLNIWVKANNINTEKLELFFDYLNGLYSTVIETYLGDDVIKEDKERKEHFDWCWKNLVKNFEEENIRFKYYGHHYEYFWNFFYESFYINKKEENKEKISEFLFKLFSLHLHKTKSELDMLSEIYFILEDNLTVDK